MLEAAVEDAETLCFVCGPEALVHEVPRMLHDIGISPSRSASRSGPSRRPRAKWRRTSEREAPAAASRRCPGARGRAVGAGDGDREPDVGDAVYHFCHLHTLVVDRDLDPTNEIAHYQQARSSYTGLAKIGNAPPLDPVTGRAIDKYPIGSALLLLPAYAGVYVSSLALSAVAIPADITGYGWTYQLAAGWLTAVYAALGLLAMIRVCQSGDIVQDVAVAAAATVALATLAVLRHARAALRACALGDGGRTARPGMARRAVAGSRGVVGRHWRRWRARGHHQVSGCAVPDRAGA